MPRVYLSQTERQERKIIRTLSAAAKGKQKALAERWGITQSAVSQRLSKGNVTLLDLWKARDVLDMDGEDLEELIGERKV